MGRGLGNFTLLGWLRSGMRRWGARAATVTYRWMADGTGARAADVVCGSVGKVIEEL